MLDTKTLPHTLADATVVKSFSLNDDIKLTYTSYIDEQQLYQDLSKQLMSLERSLEIHQERLQEIREQATFMQFSIDEKQEILLRIDWLDRLYRVKEEVNKTNSKDKAKQLRRLLSPVQTCPLKQQLLANLSELEQSLPEENVIPMQPPKEEHLMEEAIERAGDVFINLGKVGREYIINDVLEQFGDNAGVAHVKEATAALEQRVADLSSISDRNELIARLERLPLKTFSSLKNARKEAIADRLIETNQWWNGLAALNRQIAQLDKVITKEEQEKDENENTVLTDSGRATFTLNINGNADNYSKIITLN